MPLAPMLKGGGPWDGTRNEVKLPPPPELGDMFRIGGEVGTAVRGIDVRRAGVDSNRLGAVRCGSSVKGRSPLGGTQVLTRDLQLSPKLRAARNRQGATTSELRSNTLLLRPEGWMARSGSVSFSAVLVLGAWLLTDPRAAPSLPTRHPASFLFHPPFHRRRLFAGKNFLLRQR